MRVIFSIILLVLFWVSCESVNEPKNEPPCIPYDPNPPSGSTTRSIYPIVSWSCYDPENDPLLYDVYRVFKYWSNDTLIIDTLIVNLEHQNLTDCFCVLKISQGTNYWRVIAKSGDYEIKGPAWKLDYEW